MRRVIDKNHIAVLYETITGQCQKRGVITIGPPYVEGETADIDMFLANNPGLDAVIITRDSLPGLHAVEPIEGQPVTANEHHFRQAIADHTGKPYFPHGADRAVMVAPDGRVVSEHHGNVPGLDRPGPGHQLMSHPEAVAGDRWDGSQFHRRHVAINPAGIVTHELTAPLGRPPDPPSPHHKVREAPQTALKVGDKVDK